MLRHLIERHLVLILAALLGEGADALMDPLIAVDLGATLGKLLLLGLVLVMAILLLLYLELVLVMAVLLLLRGVYEIPAVFAPRSANPVDFHARRTATNRSASFAREIWYECGWSGYECGCNRLKMDGTAQPLSVADVDGYKKYVR